MARPGQSQRRAEEDLALGGYVDRVVVELAQNAADAAARAGVAGRVLFSFRGSTLVVANTGASLSAEGSRTPDNVGL